MGKIVTLKHSGNGGGPRSAAAKHSNNGGGAKPAISTMVAEARKKLVASAGKAARTGNSGSNATRDRRLRFAELLLGISQKMSGMETLDDVLNGLVEVTTRELNAERGTLFLNDPETNELYSRVAQGNHQARDPAAQQQRHRRPRVHDGRAASSSTTPTPTRASTAAIDEQTGFITRNILCVPIRTAKGEIIGVAQSLNKQRGAFTQERS